MSDEIYLGKTGNRAFRVPLEAVTQTFAIVAKRGMGKTYTGAVLMEELVEQGQQCVAFDPIGVLYGLRMSAGKGSGLPVVILGGERGDLPLEPTAGKLVADWVVNDRRSAVLDMSLMRKAEQRRFVQDFAEEVYRRNKEPLHLLIDEADAFAPQRPMPGEQGMLGAMEDLVRRGRARGIGLTLITQRPAVIHKDVLTQCEVLIALRMVGPQDIAAVDAWIKYHGDEGERRKVLASLSKLPVGTAWFWSPGWLGKLQQVKIRRRKTFDSSSTPKPGTKRLQGKMAPIEIEALRKQMTEVVVRAEQQDPKRLQRRIAELKAENVKLSKQLEQARRQKQPAPVQVPKSVLKAAEYVAEWAKKGQGVESLDEFPLILEPPKNAPPPYVKKSAAPSVMRSAPAVSGLKGVDAGTLPKGELAILRALCQHGDKGCTRTQLTVLTGYKRSTRDAYIQRLREKELVEIRGTRVHAMPTAYEVPGASAPLPKGRALAEYWLAKLPAGEAAILDKLLENGPLDRQRLTDATGYKRSTRDAYIQRLLARELVHVSAGEVVASEELF